MNQSEFNSHLTTGNLTGSSGPDRLAIPCCRQFPACVSFIWQVPMVRVAKSLAWKRSGRIASARAVGSRP